MRFSSRLPRELAANRLTAAVRAARASGREMIDLTESNPTRVGIAYAADLLAPLADERGLAYSPSPAGAGVARDAVAADYARQGIAVDPDRIVLTASTSDAYSLLFKLLADPGDEVLVPRPSYPLFDYLTRLDAVSSRPYDLDFHGRWAIDFESVVDAMSERTRAVLIVSPNNPTGSFATRAEFARLSALGAERGVAIIADEVFADYELTPGARANAGRAAAVGDALTFALGGLAKSVGLPQVKLGWIVVGGPDVEVAAALDRLEYVADTYLSVSTPVQLAAPELIRRGAAIRSEITDRITANYLALHEWARAVPSCSVLPSDGGWYAVLQVPSLESEEALVLRLLEHDGVLVHPGYFFDFPRESFLVVSLLPPPMAFEAGVDRVLRHFDCTVKRTI